MESKPRRQGSVTVGAASALVGGHPSGYSSKLVAEQNECVQAIPMPLSRIEELPTELNRFFAAAQANCLRMKFDVEPASFLVSLSHSGKGKA